SEVLQHIQTDYVEDPNMPAVTAGALRGLLESLDADSSYLSPADYKAYKTDRGGKAQIGVDVSKRYGYAVVVSVIPNSPADKAGLNDGDIIQAIGTQDTRDLSLAMIQKLLEGAPGSDLTLAVVRPRKAAPDKITVTRAPVAEPPVTDAVMEGGTILDLRPAVLDREHVDGIEARLKSAAKGADKKVVLDLRDVSSGQMEQGVRLANFFLKSGTIATLQGQKVAKQTFAAEPGKSIDPTAPLVILVNRGTAGPGELVAAAIEDNKRGEVVGEKTFGEGAQQKTFELPDGGAIILSIAKYGSPSGKAYEDEGVAPTVTVASSEDEQDTADDDAAAAAKKPSRHSEVQTDDQLNKALEILKGKAA
ncbi:MAG TPA: S41 family peptidase, partial [Acidobacteriaceae bacterium]|nr:S41 family peptidase [Acidobacteriaceae bacterium]